MLLISLCFDRNGQNILYRHAVRYGNITCSTSSQISINFGKFRQFWLNCTFRPISNLGNLKKKLKKKKKKHLHTYQSEVPTMSLVAILLLLFSISSSPSFSSLLHFFFTLLFFFFYSFNFLVSTIF